MQNYIYIRHIHFTLKSDYTAYSYTQPQRCATHFLPIYLIGLSCGTHIFLCLNKILLWCLCSVLVAAPDGTS